jgi:hypothetical protein
MARLCVRIRSNSHRDPDLNVMRTQEGDVVEIQEDGHAWSPAELACGEYRFLDVPGVPAADLAALVAPVVDVDQRVVRRRAATLDAAVLKAGEWSARTTATKTQLATITVARVY